ncbi:MAG: hypothetical protein J5661_04365 [Bacteroidaceae bacterium]|nr:hypothetical protein [Bacteroidaceae bacterium]
MKRKLLSMFTLAVTLLWGTSSWAQKTYEIGTAEELAAFAEAVTNGETDANAVLTADIDYTAFPQAIIGISSDDYQGTFDGQGHKVTVAIEREADGASLFWAIGKSGVVKNLITDGTITSSRKFATGIATYNSGVIRNCASYVTINSSIEGDGTHGGIAGCSYDGSLIENCLSAIKINGEKTTNCGGVVGWLSGKTTLKNNLCIAEINLGTNDGSDSFCRNNGNMTSASGNNYFLTQYSSYNAAYCAQCNQNMIQSGAICYLLNTDQTDIQWYQTLGQDANPIPFATSKQVYAKCDDISCVGKCKGEASYANEPTGNTPAPHEYEKGICKNCGKEDADYCPLVDGYYQISNAEQLQWFGQKISNGNNEIKGKLTADIDFSEYGKIVESGDFKGELDGQFHTLTINIGPSANPAPFNSLYGTVKNLKVAGNIDAGENKFAAGIAAHTYSGSQVLNCTSSINITSAVSGDGTHAGLVAVNESGLTIKFCIFNGSMIGENTANCGGIVGWSSSGTKMTGCVVMPVQVTPGTIENTGSRNPGNVNAVGCYYVETEAAPCGTPNDGFTAATEEAAASGEICYKMNGDQSVIGWTQNLGTDAWPNNEGLGKQVYTTAEMNCDGRVKEGATGSYSNDPSVQAPIPDHVYENGVCVNCGAKEPGFMEPDAEGFYNIADAKQLVWYASNINSGDTQAKGRLTADIDMEGMCDKFVPIGTEANCFNATFDGQGHRISNLVVEQETNCAGLFGYIKAPCTIENLVLDETCSITGAAYSGLIGESIGGTGGDIYMTNLGNEGTVTTGGVNAGGIIGCCMSSSATFHITNCYTTGAISGGGESGQLSGWVGSDAEIVGCWSTSEVTGTESDDRYSARYGSIKTAERCYSLYGTQVTRITEDQVTNGELAWLLNGESFVNPGWYQTIGEDLHPVLDNTHGVVYKANDSFADVHDAETYQTFVKAYTQSEQDYCDNVTAQRTLVEDYAASLASLYEITSMSEFAAAYAELTTKKDAVVKSEEAYAAYAKKVTETLEYLEGEGAELAGAARDFLADYLELDDAPGTYPNGAAGYILAEQLLNEEELAAEIDYINQMIDAAVRGSIMPGTDVTALIQNPTFLNGFGGNSGDFGGWEGKKATGTGSNENYRAAECWASTMDMYQTLTDLQNGVYELQINGAFRPYQDPKGNNYAATFYMNDLQNYFQADIEDYIPVEDAVDGVNCYLDPNGTTDLNVTDEEGNTIGYVAHGPTGLCYAINADRYNNSLLVNVTDGTLTLGIKNMGTRNVARDWLGFGNIHLIYRGEMDEATDAMDDVLACMSARANTILNDYQFSNGDDYNLYPNFSQATKVALQETMDAVAGAADAEAKYALIQKFSELFQEVYDCKEAYIDMVSMAESLSDVSWTLVDVGKMTSDEAKAMEALAAECWIAFEDGSYTLEQARNIEALKNNTIAANEVDGVYQIGNDLNLIWFSALVNSGTTNANAVLTADIDMTGINLNPIGTATNYYVGHFDGQGHKFSNLNIDSGIEDGGVGLFGLVAPPAVIENFVLDNTCSISGTKFAGPIGESQTGITGDLYMRNIGNEGTVTTINQNAGGIFGCCMSSSATIHIENCYSTGEVTGGNESGAISGWVGSNAEISNSWSISKVNGSESDAKYFARCGSVTTTNCWSKYGSQVNTLTDLQVTSGALCFVLNGSSSEDPVWFQHLGVDAHPKLFGTAIVYNYLGEYTNTNPNAIEDITIEDVEKGANTNVYSIDGRLIKENATAKDLRGLKGVYIIGRHKYLIK